jgi:sulfate adenylyltransferase subunit 2
MLLADCDFIPRRPHEVPAIETVRFRTIGDMTCTGAVRSNASSASEIVREVATLRVTERGTRSDDKRSETAMEDRKKQGYF